MINTKVDVTFLPIASANNCGILRPSDDNFTIDGDGLMKLKLDSIIEVDNSTIIFNEYNKLSAVPQITTIDSISDIDEVSNDGYYIVKNI